MKDVELKTCLCMEGVSNDFETSFSHWNQAMGLKNAPLSVCLLPGLEAYKLHVAQKLSAQFDSDTE